MYRIRVEKIARLKRNYPAGLFSALLKIAEIHNEELYLVGGSVRDCLLARRSNDLDIAVSHHAVDCAKSLIRELGTGTFVDISGPEDEGGRVVAGDIQVDIAAFRGGTEDINEDLCLRDFTCNAMALSVQQLTDKQIEPDLIDPMSGLVDLKNGQIKHCPGAFGADPVRMLRGYRLCAELNFFMDRATVKEVEKHAALITAAAVERIDYELKRIFDSPRTTQTIRAMDESGLFAVLLPELYLGAGVEQPGFHHLDVLGHSFLALEMMEKIIAAPEMYFHDKSEKILQYLEQDAVVRCLKWAALMHDIGKPSTRKIRTDKDGRVTFYNHDEVGVKIFNRIARRLRWNNVDKKLTGSLVAMHMHPFHLCNVQREEGISKRAALKLCHRAGNDLLGLFLLAMSDSLASSGKMKPEGMEQELMLLFDTILHIYDKDIKPVECGPRLLTGSDLIEEFALTPGPIFAQILQELEMAQVEGMVTDRSSALAWVKKILQHTP